MRPRSVSVLAVSALAVSALAPLITACGAICSPGPFLVPIDSRPPGATVIYDEVEVGVTPCVVAMHRGARRLELVRAGHPRQYVAVGTRPNRWIAANVASFGLGMLVDEALGTDVDLVTDPIAVTLPGAGDGERGVWVGVAPAPAVDPAREPTALGSFVGLVLQALAAHWRR
jgi:hypothetical protein